MTPTNSIRVARLKAGYEGSEVLTGFDCQVGAGEVVALLGRNGMGKSTAVSAIAGTLRVTEGTVELGGRDVTEQSPSARYRTGLRVVRQTQPVFAGLSIAENLALVGSNLDRASACFGFLAGRGRQVAGTLSGGEQKMLALARVASDPGTMWVLDEPTEGLQPANVDRCAELISDAARRGVAVLLVEQHLTMALAVASRWLVIERGRVIDQGDVTPGAELAVRQHLTI